MKCDRVIEIDDAGWKLAAVLVVAALGVMLVGSEAWRGWWW